MANKLSLADDQKKALKELIDLDAGIEDTYEGVFLLIEGYLGEASLPPPGSRSPETKKRLKHVLKLQERVSRLRSDISRLENNELEDIDIFARIELEEMRPNTNTTNVTADDLLESLSNGLGCYADHIDYVYGSDYYLAKAIDSLTDIWTSNLKEKVTLSETSRYIQFLSHVLRDYVSQETLYKGVLYRRKIRS